MGDYMEPQYFVWQNNLRCIFCQFRCLNWLITEKKYPVQDTSDFEFCDFNWQSWTKSKTILTKNFVHALNYVILCGEIVLLSLSDETITFHLVEFADS